MDPELERHQDFVTESGHAGAAGSEDRSSTLASWLNISHELRTPANAILGHLDLLLSGAAGPLARDIRASLGDVQKAGLDLLVQIDRAIKVGQQLAWPPLPAPEAGTLFVLLAEAWSKAEADPAAVGRTVASDGERHEHRSERWLRVVAALLHDLGATPPGPSGREASSASTSLCEIDHSPVVELRLDYLCGFQSDFSTSLMMIEAALMMTGGVLNHEPGQLVLTWPSRKRQLHSERATAQSLLD